MMVAANVRKEVTSTALWLLGNGIQVQCFKATPFSDGEQLYLSVDQIIPTPEAKEFMIGINAKEAEEKNTEVEAKNRHRLRREFWSQTLDALQESNCSLYSNVNSSTDHWLSAGSGVSGCPFTMIFSKREARVELWIARPDKAVNKDIFDQLIIHQSELNSEFGADMEWLRLDDRKSSRIQFSQPFDGYNSEKWPVMIEWLVEHMTRFEKVMKQPLAEAWKAVRNS
jgi:hypothetical protein